MSLTTGKIHSRQQWTELTMPDGVIERVEKIAVAQNSSGAQASIEDHDKVHVTFKEPHDEDEDEADDGQE